MSITKDISQPQPLVINFTHSDIHLSPAQFERLQSDNPDLRLRLTAEGKLIVGDPVAAVFEEVVSSKKDIMPPAEVPENDNATQIIPLQHQESVSEFMHQPQASKALNFAEMTMQGRVDAIEKHKKNRQAIIDSLTPEELDLSNQQFEHMFKQLEESRDYNYS